MVERQHKIRIKIYEAKLKMDSIENKALLLPLQSSSSLKDKDLAKQAFSLPSKEDIQDCSLPKIREMIVSVCDELIKKKIFLKAYAFRGKYFKENKNERALLHTFVECYKKRPRPKTWAYCKTIIDKQDLTQNEYDNTKASR